MRPRVEGASPSGGEGQVPTGWAGPGGPKGVGSAVSFPTHFPRPGIREHRAGRHPGERRGAAPGAAQDAPGSRSSAARSARGSGPRGKPSGARPRPAPPPPRPGPAQGPPGGRPPAQDWHGRASEPGANSTTWRPRCPGPPSSRGDSDPAREAEFPRKPPPAISPRRRAHPAVCVRSRHPQRRPRRPDAPEALPANANAAAGRDPGRFRRRGRPLLRAPQPRPPLTRGRRGSEPGAPAGSLREGAPPPRPPSAPQRALASDRQHCRAQRRTRGHGRACGRAGGRGAGSSLRLGRRLLLRRRRRLPSSGLCCNVCEADFERLARRPPAAALLPPPLSPPRPSPSPRRSTPFSSSAKFLNPFFPFFPIVTGAGGRLPGPGGSRELRCPLGWLVFLLARPPAGRAGTAGPRGGGRTAAAGRGGCSTRPRRPPRLPALSSRRHGRRRPDSSSRGPGGTDLETQAKGSCWGHSLGAGTPRVPSWVPAP